MNTRSNHVVLINAKIDNFDALKNTDKMIKTKISFLIAFFLSITTFAQSINQVDELGQKQGKWIKTYENGNTRYEGQFRDNQAYGTFTYYFESGAKEAINKFSDDGVIAEALIYHSNGKLLAEGNFVNKVKHGLWKYYSDLDEKLVAEENYKKGQLDGESKNYYAENGNILEITFYKQGKLEGPYQKYFPNEILMTEGFYKNDLLEGEFVSYYQNGKAQTIGNYTAGIQTGKWEYFDEHGNLLTEEEYKSEKPQVIKEN